jgi:UDP-glucose 4-epimerase
MKILLTGGLGFIGSHTAVSLHNCDHDVIIVDDLSNSTIDVFSNLQSLCTTSSKLYLHIGDVTNCQFMESVFRKNKPDAVIHFASLKSVHESIEHPLMYYRQNINGLLTLITVMEKYGCNRLVFSSSSTVYGKDQSPPFKEDSPVGSGITNPYGETKYFQECILQDYAKTNPKINILILRYFNPVGAHPSGLIGEMPKGKPGNLFPCIMRVVSSEYPILQIYGGDYKTHDGTCIRDFIHVMDLAEGHVLAFNQSCPGCHIYNLGLGKGYSVLKLLKTFEKVNNVSIPYQIKGRRKGDVGEVYSDVSKARLELNWVPTRTIEDICRDGYRFAMNNSLLNQSV